MNSLILRAANKYGLGVGSASLRGCLHDMPGEFNWIRTNLLPKYPDNINVVVAYDEQHTCAKFDADLVEAGRRAGKGEFVAIKVSSHGAPPGLVCFDSNWNDQKRTFMSAQRLGEIFSAYNPGTMIYLSIDACEFGDSLRALVGPVRDLMPRFVDDPTRQVARDFTLPSALIPRGIPNLVTLAGCQRGKTCADVQDALGAYGAFSHFEIPNRGAGRKVSEIVAACNRDFGTNQYEQQCVSTGPDVPWCSVK